MRAAIYKCNYCPHSSGLRWQSSLIGAIETAFIHRNSMPQRFEFATEARDVGAFVLTESVAGKQSRVDYMDYPVGGMEIGGCDGGRTALFIRENNFAGIQSCCQRAA